MAENQTPQAKSAEAAQHAKAAARAFVLTWKSLLPDKFWDYSAEFGRESALALQTAVEAAIERLERNEGNEPPPARPTRKARVEVE